ncbi:hypothetical protein [Vibrio sonorensis]|nr:hypothetical protein [Vibrio sonorensis]
MKNNRDTMTSKEKAIYKRDLQRVMGVFLLAFLTILAVDAII